ncbi:MAG: ATP-binding protein [Deltaproteobacteria bacterium]|nr:ATP-binding protein [Deltaproteobacteria bacterium]
MAALATAALGVFVAVRGPRGELRAAFLFFAATLVFWHCFYLVLYLIPDYQTAFEGARILRVGSFYMVAAVLHLAVSARARPRRLWRWIVIGNYALATSFVVANVFDVWVKELRRTDAGYVTVGTRWYSILSLYALLNFLVAISLSVRDYWITRDPRVRQQVGFWLAGMLVALPLGLTNFLPVYGVEFPPLGNLGAALWTGIVAYAIVRHRLMDIDVFVTKGLAYAAVTLVLVTPAIAVSVILQWWAFRAVDYEFTAALAVLFLSIAVCFPLVVFSAEERLQRSLFRARTQTRRDLAAFSRSMVKILDRQRLMAEICNRLHDLLDVERVAIYLLDSSGTRLELRKSQGTHAETTEFGSQHPFVRWLGRRSEPSLREDAEGLDTVQAVFVEQGWEVCLPMHSGRQMLGFLALGARHGRQAFAGGDLEQLAAISDEAGVAFENARLYEEVRRSRAIIDRTSRLSSLGTLAAGIAHEIRNPLVSIHTFFQMAPTRLGDEEFMTSFLGLAGEEVQRISSLVDELLIFGKSTTTNPTEVQPNEVVDRGLALLAPQARQKNVTLDRSLSESLPPVLADGDQLLQVLVNLLLNAIQATLSGGRVTVETRLITDETGEFCQIEIVDTGVGIPASVREAIFDPFFTTKDRGTGLGLSVAHRIVAEFGGFLSVESAEGQGSRFSVNLPACRNLEFPAGA